MIQRIINRLYRHPKAAMKRCARFGGWLSYRRMLQNQKAMQHASFNLPPVISHQSGLPVYFLTGKKYLYQTLFCISSLHHFSNEQFRFILVDDGTFDEKLIDRVTKQLPEADLILSSVIEKQLDMVLPAMNYPVLRHKRTIYPHIKKLTDIHTLPGEDWKLVLDSDMLFYNNPVDMIGWLRAPSAPLHMIDCTESYGYSGALMKQLAHSTIPALLNVGAIGLKSSTINWKNLECWTKTLEEQEGSTYYLEQALTAMLIGANPAIALSADQYIVNPGSNLISTKNGVLHHYVDLSKKGYYNAAWKQFING